MGMARGRLQCRNCERRAVDGWYISSKGMCRLCARERAGALVDAMFPPDPIIIRRLDGTETVWVCDHGEWVVREERSAATG